MPTFYIKKICSLNPTKYKFIKLETAQDKYSRYLFTIHDYKPATSAKTFKQWCATEI